MKAGELRKIAIVVLLAMQLFGQSNPGMDMQEAIKKEQVDGDLKAAMAIYHKIGADTSAPRDLRVKALLHLGRCYEKLGQQAQTVYRQIVREFGDQPEAAQAKARLAVLAKADHPLAPAVAPAGMTERKIERPSPSVDSGDTDGRRVVYPILLPSGEYEVIYGDLAGTSRRGIFKAKLDDIPRVFAPRDFSLVGLLLHARSDGPRTVAVVNTDGTGYREIAQLDASRLGFVNWSWDDRSILLSGAFPGVTNRLLTISVADGKIRELLSLKTGTVSYAQFSPDGRFVAYEITPDRSALVSQILIMPAEGREPQAVYEERPTAGDGNSLWALKLLDWTADGSYLAIASARTGRDALYLLPMMGGKSTGAPVFVKYGDFMYGVTTATGGLVHRSGTPSDQWNLYLASLDSNSRPGDWRRVELSTRTFPGLHWSGDSNQIVYVSTGVNGGSEERVVHLRNLSTGEDREIYHAPGSVTCAWAAQQPKLFCVDLDKGSSDIFSIAVPSGEVARLHTFPALALRMAETSRDDRALFMSRSLIGGGELLRWEIATGQQTILGRFPAGSRPSVSPDERWLIRSIKQNLEILSTSGGDWRPLVSLSKDFPAGTGHVRFTSDGKWVIYHDVDSTGKHSLFRIAVGGGTPERLGDFPTKDVIGSLEISPDGTKIIVASRTSSELWLLESFAPPAPKRWVR